MVVGASLQWNDLQPVTKYLRLTLIFMWSSALQEDFSL